MSGQVLASETGSVAARLRLVLPSLSESDHRIADILIGQPELVSSSSVSEVGELVGVSAATVVRACRRLGFEGFHDVKVSLMQDLARGVGADSSELTGALPEGADSLEVLQRVLAAGSQGLQDARITVSEESFAFAVELLVGAGQALFIGGGSSSGIATDAAYWFNAIGVPSSSPEDPMAQLLAARNLPSDGVCVAVSHSGAYRQTVDAARAARDAGAKVVVVTSFAKAPLADVGDLSLVAGGRSLGYRLEASAGRVVHLAILDALRIAVARGRGQRALDALDQMADFSRGQQL